MSVSAELEAGAKGDVGLCSSLLLLAIFSTGCWGKIGSISPEKLK